MVSLEVVTKSRQIKEKNFKHCIYHCDDLQLNDSICLFKGLINKINYYSNIAE